MFITFLLLHTYRIKVQFPLSDIPTLYNLAVIPTFPPFIFCSLSHAIYTQRTCILAGHSRFRASLTESQGELAVPRPNPPNPQVKCSLSWPPLTPQPGAF